MDSAANARAANSVLVRPARHGAWEVEFSEHDPPVMFETLEEARRMGYLYGSRRTPSELVVRDAYHRIVQRRTIGGEPPPLAEADAAAGSGAAGARLLQPAPDLSIGEDENESPGGRRYRHSYVGIPLPGGKPTDFGVWGYALFGSVPIRGLC